MYCNACRCYSMWLSPNMPQGILKHTNPINLVLFLLKVCARSSDAQTTARNKECCSNLMGDVSIRAEGQLSWERDRQKSKASSNSSNSNKGSRAVTYFWYIEEACHVVLCICCPLLDENTHFAAIVSMSDPKGKQHSRGASTFILNNLVLDS